MHDSPIILCRINSAAAGAWVIPKPSNPAAIQVLWSPGTGPSKGLPSLVAARAPVHVLRIGNVFTEGTNRSHRSITLIIILGSTGPGSPGLREDPRHS